MSTPVIARFKDVIKTRRAQLGGILNDGNGASLTLQGSSRVTENQADQGGGIFNRGGTVTIASASSVTINEPDNCVGTTACGA